MGVAPLSSAHPADRQAGLGGHEGGWVGGAGVHVPTRPSLTLGLVPHNANAAWAPRLTSVLELGVPALAETPNRIV